MFDEDEEIDDTVETTPESQESEDDAAPEDEGAEGENNADDAAPEDEGAEGEDKPVTEKSGSDASSGRKENRLAKLSKERNDLREKLARAEALAEERARPVASVNHAEANRVREEKLALMDPTERKEFLFEEKVQNLQQQVLFTQIQTADTIDRSNYQVTARSNPVFSKHASEVERRLSAERNQGRNWSREQILAQIVGEAALKAKPDKKGKEEARERVGSTKGKPIPGRSNTGTGYRPSRGNESLDDLERRLENVTF